MRTSLFATLLLCIGFLSTEADEPVADRVRFWASGDVIVWTPHLRGLDFAATENGNALSIGVGQSHEVDHDQNAGIRGQVGIITPVGWGIGFGYTHFSTEGANTVNRPPGAGQLFASYSHPGGPAEAETAAAETGFDYSVFDLEARRSIVNCSNVTMDVFGGLRWADLGHDITARFDGIDFSNGVLANTTKVDALGIRFGGVTSWRMGGGLSAYGQAAGAVMYGKFDQRRFESNFTGAQVLVDFRDQYVQPIFNLDSSLGLSWERNNWVLSGGYELNLWTNLGESIRFADDIEPGSIASLSGDLLLEGFFFRVAKIW